jgi:hypothetical protein
VLPNSSTQLGTFSHSQHHSQVLLTSSPSHTWLSCYLPSAVLFDHDVAGGNDEIGKAELSVEKIQDLLAGVAGKVEKRTHILTLNGVLCH